MFKAAHVVMYSADAEADRAFLREVCGFDGVDAGGGWMIYALPPSEVAVHPAEAGGTQELFLLVDDVAAARAALIAKGVACSAPSDEGWGLLMRITIPSGATLGVYEPRHPQPHRG